MIDIDYRKKLLQDDIVPKKLNEVVLKHREELLKEIDSNIIKTEYVENCICCGHNELEILSKVDRFGLPFGSLICPVCGLISTSKRIKEESLPYYYDKFYHLLNFGGKQLNAENSLYANGQGKKIFEILKPLLPTKEKLKVLEIGAGTGSVLKEFKEYAKKNAYDVDELGTEYSKECIGLCVENNINVIEGNINTVVEMKETYDVIILSHVFEHFVNLKKELSSLKKIMTKQTLLYIEVPGLMVNHKKGYYEFSYLIYHVHAHMYNFTSATLENIMKKNSFANLYSNNEIESVYKLSNDYEHSINNDYDNIMNYLLFLDENHDYFMAEYSDKVFYKRQYIQQEKTIKNREKSIEGKEYLVEKLQEKIRQQEKTIKNREESIEGKEYLVEKLQEKIRQQEKTIKNREESIEGKEYLVEKLQEKIRQQEKTIKNREESIEGKEYLVEKLQEKLEGKEKIILLTQKMWDVNIFKNPIRKYRMYKNLKDENVTKS